MHELGIALEIVDRAEARADGATVQRVVVEVGAMTAVLPDALRFAWDVVVEGTALAGATLEIIELAGEELRIREMEVSHVRDMRMRD